MADQIDKVIERLAHKIAWGMYEVSFIAPDDADMLGPSSVQVEGVGSFIAAQLEPIQRVLEAAQVVAHPPFHSHGDFALEDATQICPNCQAQAELRKALADLEERNAG